MKESIADVGPGSERLRGRVAIVTGGGSGIGREICRLFASEGAKVAVADVNRQAADETVDDILAGRREAVAVLVNVADAKSVTELAADTEKRWGRIDVLVNNVGIIVPGAADETTDEGWDENIAVNLTGVFLGCRAVLPTMVRQGRGAIVNISSVSALHPVPRRAGYAAAKAGVIGLTRSVAIDYAGFGVRANAIGPGTVDTPLLNKRLTDSKIKAAVLRGIPMGRIAEPGEIARVALFLASDDSSYMTGQMLLVDGGLSVA